MAPLARVRHAAPVYVALLLLAVPFAQSPCKTTFDTKLDLTENPWGFLHRALHLWDPEGSFGQLQNQAFGYLFPIGPFFGIGHSLGISPWVTQRLWAGLLLALGCEGMRRLVRVLDAGGPAAALIAGLSYALAPRILTVLGPISAEALPAMLLPWALLPLVRWGDRDPRRAATLSGLVVVCMGGANAALTLAVLPAPFLWVLTRRRRARLLGWWSLTTFLACAWWLVPLALLGSYSPPFLGWVESSADTTRPLGLLPVLRGTDHWVAYLQQGGQGVWPAGNLLVVNVGLVIATGLVAVFGLAGLVNKALPERSFLGLTALSGLLLLALGHTGAGTAPWASSVQDLLDGALAPLRNVHKFDPLLRLPLAVGLACVIQQGIVVLARRSRPSYLAPYAAVLLVFVTALPLAFSGFRPGPGFEGLPSWWHQTADYLDEHGAGSSLVVPGAGFVRQTWGRTVDEPLQPLAGSPWEVRGKVPLGSAGSTRLMDAVEGVLQTGRGSASLAALLARSGVGQLVVRNDLDVAFADTLPQARVHAALAGSPGLKRIAAFGPPVAAEDAGLVIGAVPTYPSVEIWSVAGDPARVTTAPTSDVTGASGGPEGVLSLLEAGAISADEPVVLGPDGGSAFPSVDTDTLRLQQRSFGRVHDAQGQTRAVADGFNDGRAVHDLLPANPAGHQTVFDYGADVRSVTAKSSASDGAAPRGADPSSPPWAALDGNVRTSWRSASYTGPVGQWWQVTLRAKRDVQGVVARFVNDPLVGPAVTRVRVTTDQGSIEQSLGSGALVTPPGRTRSLRIMVIGVAGKATAGEVQLSEVTVPGITLTPSLDLPRDVNGSGVVAGLDPEPIPACVRTPQGAVCDDTEAGRAGELVGLSRTFWLTAPQTLVLSGSALPRPGTDLFALLDPLAAGERVTASSTLGSSPLVRPASVLDGNVRTAWLPARSDTSPTLTFTWPAAKALSELTLSLPRSAGMSVPLALTLTTPTRTVMVTPDSLGHATFPTLTTDHVEVTFPAVEPGASIDPLYGLPGTSPIAVGELRFGGEPTYAPSPTGPTGAPCGFGPTVLVDGKAISSRVVGTVADLLDSRPLQLVPCGPSLSLAAGRHTVTVQDAAAFIGRTVSLLPARDLTARGQQRRVVVSSWRATERRVTLAPGGSALLIVRENANTGWRATLNGEELPARTVDGWQQGWLIPAGGPSVVTLTFAPDHAYRIGLLGGAVGVGLLALLGLVACLRPRDRRLHSNAPSPQWPYALLAVLVPVALGGLWGLVVVVPLALLGVKQHAALRLLAPGALALALVWATVDRLGGTGPSAELALPVQLLALLAVSAAVVSAHPRTMK